MRKLSIAIYTLIILTALPARAQIQVSSGFERQSAVPLDTRSVQPTLTARDAIPSLVRYNGMTVFVTAEDKAYRLVGGITNADWVEEGSGAGDITGPVSSTDNAIVLFDGITGKVIKQSAMEFQDVPGASVLRTPDLATAGHALVIRGGNTTSATPTDLAGDITIRPGDAPSSAQAGEISFVTDAIERLRILRDGVFSYAENTVLRFLDSGSNSVGVRGPPTVSTSYEVTLPEDPPTAGKALISDGAGQLSWGDAGGKTVQKNYFTDPFFDSEIAQARPYTEQTASSVGFFDGGGSGYATLTGHGLTTGDPITLYTSGTMPTGPLSPGVTYYAVVLNTNSFAFSYTPGGPAIAFTDSTGSGNYTVRKYNKGHFSASAGIAGLVEGGSLRIFFTDNATSAIGDGVEIGTKTIDAQDRGKTLYLRVSNDGLPNTYVNNDLEFRVIDASTGRILNLLSGHQFTRTAQSFLLPIYTTASTSKVVVSVHMASDNATGNFSTTFGTWSLVVDTPVPGAIITPWQAYTPSTTGFGTVSNLVCMQRRNGSNREISCRFTAGTVTASEARVDLPIGDVVSSAITALRNVGTGARSGGAGLPTVLANGGLSYLNFSNAAGSNTLAAVAGNGVVGNNESVSFFASVPIQGWDAGAMLSTTETLMQGSDVWAVGNAGQAITATTTDVPFNTITNKLGEWTGSAFVPKSSGRYRLTGNIWFTAALAREVGLYENGVSYKRHSNGQNDSAFSFVFEVDLVAGRSYSIRMITNGGTLNSGAGSDTLHYLSIRRSFDPTVFSVYGQTKVYSSVDNTNRVPSTPALGSWALVPTWKLDIPEAGEYDIILNSQYDIRVNAQNGYVQVALSTSTTPGSGLIKIHSPGWVNSTASDNNNHKDFWIRKTGHVTNGPSSLYLHARVVNASGASSITNFEFRNDLAQGEIQARKVK